MSGLPGVRGLLKLKDDRRPGLQPNARLTPAVASTSSCGSSGVVRRCAWRPPACNVALSTAHHFGSCRWRAATTDGRASLACLLDRSGAGPIASPPFARRRSPATCRRGASADRLGAEAARRSARPRAPDGLESAPSPRLLTLATRLFRGRPIGMVAVSGRSFCAWTSRPTRDSAKRPQGDARLPHDEAGKRHLDGLRGSPTRSSTTTPAWPTSSCTPTSAQTPSSRSPKRAPRLVSERGIDAARLMTDNAWAYTKSPRLAASCSPPARSSTSRHKALPAAHQRQGRALPPDDGPRMGLRPDLPLKQRPRRGPATLAQPLQRATPPQRTRQPATHQPRSQPLKAGHLGVVPRSVVHPGHPGRLSCQATSTGDPDEAPR